MLNEEMKLLDSTLSLSTQMIHLNGCEKISIVTRDSMTHDSETDTLVEQYHERDEE